MSGPVSKAHTPGPWELSRAGHSNSLFVREVANPVARAVALVCARTDQIENANLIAAAPDLVEALRAAVNAMRAPLDDWKGEVERVALDAARAALRKAGVTL